MLNDCAGSLVPLQVSHVVLCVPDVTHRDAYAEVLPLYFPRSASEASIARETRPLDLGDERGQAILHDRQSSLFTSVLSVPVAEREGNSLLEDCFAEEISEALGGDFMTMKDAGESAAEHKRVIGASNETTRLQAQEKHYESLLEQARKPPHTEVSQGLRRLGAIYKSGLDRHGRTVVVCNMAPLVAAQPAHHHVLLHLVDFMDELVTAKFCIVYIHADLPSEYRPSYKWLKAVHSMLAYRYRKNLQHLFILNSTVWLSTALAFVVPPTRKLWQTKLHYIDAVEDLHTCIEPNQLLIEPGLVKPPAGAMGLFRKFKKGVQSVTG